ncbi:MAG: protein kinase [Lentisphaeraceae bacterium]|nr:protein kinase [Lentisphaeraceae bacterium]
MGESIKIRKIGKYILKEKLGEGSMGSVWLSYHTGLNMPVAIKLLDMKQAEEDPDFLNRFMQEGRLAGQLNHKNIVRIYDAGMEGNSAYIVMEYIEGCDTLELLEARGALPPDEVLGLAIGISEALQEAHSLGIIHRDIKPDNILATTEGRIKLADLGLAKHVDDNLGGTMAGTALGTPYYIAPEQALDAIKADARSDIYSFGATLYHLLAGVVPYEGDNPMGVMLRHTNEALVPPQKKKPGLPVSFCNVICKMMEKDPDDRYQNCHELHEDLIKLKYGHDDVAQTSEKQLKGQLAAGKSVRVKMKIPVSEKYGVHDKSPISPKGRSGSKNKKKKSKNKKSPTNKSLLTVGIIAFISALALLPSLFKKDSLPSNQEVIVVNSGKVQKEQPLQGSGNSTVAIKEETDEIDSTAVINLLEDNGKKYFVKPSRFFTFKDNRLFINDQGNKTPDELMTKDEYENFRLTAEYRYTKALSDSGIHFHAKEDRINFYEVQCSLTKSPKSGFLMARGNYYFYKNGSKMKQLGFDLENAEAPMGEWSKVVIECRGDRLKVTMNGHFLYEVEGLSCAKGFISITRWTNCVMEYRRIDLEKLD